MKTNILHGTPEWHAERRRHLNASSDVPALMGCDDAYTTPLRTWARLVLDHHRDDQETSYMRRGTLLEPMIAAEYERVTGNAVDRQDALYVDEGLHVSGTPDGFVSDPFREGRGVWEAKAPAFKTDGWREGIVPESYAWQVRTYCYLTGCTWGVVSAWLFPDGPDADLVESVYVEFTDEHRAELVKRLTSWWKRHVEQQVQPGAIVKDTRLLAELHPDDEPKTVIVPDDLMDAMYEAQRIEKNAKVALDAAKNLVRQSLGNAAWGVSADGGQAVSWRTGKRGRKLRALSKLPKAAPEPTHD